MGLVHFSYLAHVGQAEAPAWLATAGLHGHVLGHAPRDPADTKAAGGRYADCVQTGREVRLWEGGLRQQIYLGDKAFVVSMQALAGKGGQNTSAEVPRAQRRRPLMLGPVGAQSESRERALLRANIEHGITMTALARELGLSVSRVSRLIARAEADRRTAPALANNGQVSTASWWAAAPGTAAMEM